MKVNKRFSKITLISVFIFIGTASIAKHFWKGSTLTLQQVEKRWGAEKFDLEKFKKSTPNERSKMVADLLKNQKMFIGKDVSEIRAMLGGFEGHYFSDSIPTYLVFDQPKDVWQVVFLHDKQFKINEILVHKNCCE